LVVRIRIGRGADVERKVVDRHGVSRLPVAFVREGSASPAPRLRGRGLWLAAGLLALGLAAPALAKAPPAPAGKAPHFALPTAHGKVDSDSLRGRIVYVDFWASWCEPCRRSFPWMADLHQRLAPHGLTIVAINLDKDRKAADKFLADHPAPFTVAFDPGGRTAEAFKVPAMPSSFVLGRSGEILYAHAGFDPAKTAALDTLLKEACSR
jgi:thiol-disulfide isomerase/thioredoxin